MANSETKHQKQVEALRDIIQQLAQILQLDGSVELWDGSRIPLGQDVRSDFTIKVSGPGVVGSLLRRPTLDNVIRHYATGLIDFHGGTLVDFGSGMTRKRTRAKIKTLSKRKLLRNLTPFIFAPAETVDKSQGFGGDIIGHQRKTEDNQEYIQFHYDLSNEFYALFLDPEMQYSCAYFHDWHEPLEKAQQNKLEMICRKLRLKAGDRFLDIGSGWGGLICYAAKNYGVKSHGVTLSQEQLDYCQNTIQQLNLQDRVTVELKDYSKLSGTYDKIASVGMYEHIGLKNIPNYMLTVKRLLTPDGLFLNHAIARRAKKSKKAWRRIRPEQRALAKYIFPGGELDNIGHSVEAMEQAGFEIHDVEGWREHYALTTKLWCERLTARREDAIRLVGPEKFRLWIAYLAGVSLSFSRGSALIFQTLVSRSTRGPSPLPATRSDLYR